jgi:hypothetical protein
MLGVETPVGNHHDHGQVLHLRVQLKKAKTLGAQTVLEPRIGVHLHLQQHHRLLGCARFYRARPERPIETMVRRFQFRRVKALEQIAWRIRREQGHCRGACSTCRRQQQRDQVRRALEQDIEPAIRFQGPPPGTARLATKSIVRQYQWQGVRVSAGVSSACDVSAHHLSRLGSTRKRNPLPIGRQIRRSVLVGGITVIRKHAQPALPTCPPLCHHR